MFSHIAWIRSIEEHFGREIPFPVIADVGMRVSSLYGMIHPGSSGTSTVRAVFIIDDSGILRAMLYYPATNGRNIDEIVRLVEALQTSDKYNVATPANWQEGQPVIVPPPTNDEEADERLEDKKYQCVDWYYCETSVGESEATTQ